MHKVNSVSTVRNSGNHRNSSVTCAACGRQVARKARQQKFCSDRCRQFALRENKGRTALKNLVLGQDTGRVTNPYFFSSKNNGLERAKTGSILHANAPLNVLGGYRWAKTVPINPALLRTIIRREIGPSGDAQ